MLVEIIILGKTNKMFILFNRINFHKNKQIILNFFVDSFHCLKVKHADFCVF